MAAVWPASLPEFPRLEGFDESGDGNVWRTQVDAGPPIYRPKYTKEIVQLPISLNMTDAQVATFRTFYRPTIAWGSLSFEWENFLDGGTIEYCMTSRPRFGRLGPDLWRVEFGVEAML